LRDRYFANNRRISEIKEGDILSFRNAGAYILWHLITTPDTDQPKFMDEWKRTFNHVPMKPLKICENQIPLPAELAV
jgi:diaminopimelate decarboxylase